MVRVVTSNSLASSEIVKVVAIVLRNINL